jgi:hypothetical protein
MSIRKAMPKHVIDMINDNSMGLSLKWSERPTELLTIKPIAGGRSCKAYAFNSRNIYTFSK